MLPDCVVRWLYRGRRPHLIARLMNRAGAIAFGRGLWAERVNTLEVRGRRSGRPITMPVVIARRDGERYLVSMLGERAGWVANVRADHGHAVLHHGDDEPVALEEVPVAQRAPIIKAFLDVAPGARPHIPVDRAAPLKEFERIAPQYPVFHVRPA